MRFIIELKIIMACPNLSLEKKGGGDLTHDWVFVNGSRGGLSPFSADRAQDHGAFSHSHVARKGAANQAKTWGRVTYETNTLDQNSNDKKL